MPARSAGLRGVSQESGTFAASMACRAACASADDDVPGYSATMSCLRRIRGEPSHIEETLWIKSLADGSDRPVLTLDEFSHIRWSVDGTCLVVRGRNSMSQVAEGTWVVRRSPSGWMIEN